MIVLVEWRSPSWMSSWEGIGKKAKNPSHLNILIPLVLKLVQPCPSLLPKLSLFSMLAFLDMSPLGSPNNYGCEPTVSLPLMIPWGLGSALVQAVCSGKITTAVLGHCLLLVLSISVCSLTSYQRGLRKSFSCWFHGAFWITSEFLSITWKPCGFGLYCPLLCPWLHPKFYSWLHSGSKPHSSLHLCPWTYCFYARMCCHPTSALWPLLVSPPTLVPLPKWLLLVPSNISEVLCASL